LAGPKTSQMQANEPAAYLVNISDGLILHFDQQ